MRCSITWPGTRLMKISQALAALEREAGHPCRTRRRGPHSRGGGAVVEAGSSARPPRRSRATRATGPFSGRAGDCGDCCGGSRLGASRTGTYAARALWTQGFDGRLVNVVTCPPAVRPPDPGQVASVAGRLPRPASPSSTLRRPLNEATELNAARLLGVRAGVSEPGAARYPSTTAARSPRTASSSPPVPRPTSPGRPACRSAYLANHPRPCPGLQGRTGPGPTNPSPETALRRSCRRGWHQRRRRTGTTPASSAPDGTAAVPPSASPRAGPRTALRPRPIPRVLDRCDMTTARARSP